MFNSYVKLPEGHTQKPAPPKTSQGSLTLDIDALLQLQLDSKWSTEAFPGQDSKIWIYLDVAPIKQMSTGTGTYIYQIIQFFLHGFHHAAYMIQEMYGYAWKVMQNPSESSSGSGVSHLKNGLRRTTMDTAYSTFLVRKLLQTKQKWESEHFSIWEKN